MKRTDTSDWPCNIARSANLLGDLWNVLIVGQACLGTRRYEDFQRSLGIGRNILSLRLGGLVDAGVLARVEYQTSPVRHEYRLTDKGRDAYTVLAAMAAWGDRWLTGPEGTPVLQRHTSCGRDMRAVVVCSECHEPLDVREVHARPGPGFRRPAGRTSERDSVQGAASAPPPTDRHGEAAGASILDPRDGRNARGSS